MWMTESNYAEDLTQDVLVEVFHSAASFRHESSFRTWLYSIARNVCRRHLRSGRFRSYTSIDQVDEPVQDKRSDPYDSMVRSEAEQALGKAIEELPPEQRITLLLKEWQELSYNEIADILEVPVGTVRSRLHNARASLAARLAPYREGT